MGSQRVGHDLATQQQQWPRRVSLLSSKPMPTHYGIDILFTFQSRLLHFIFCNSLLAGIVLTTIFRNKVSFIFQKCKWSHHFKTWLCCLVYRVRLLLPSFKTLMYRTVFWTLWERARVGWFGRMALKHVYYHMWNKSPVQARCMIQDARGWCAGMTQRDGMGREEGEGFRMGNTCAPVADSYLCMAKPIQYCKVISLQLK